MFKKTAIQISRFVVVLLILLMIAIPFKTANAILTGTISGTLFDADGNPITWASIQVRAVLKSDGSEAAITASDAADGSYLLTGLPLDTDLAVIVSDEDPDADGYGAEYFNHVDSLDWAEVIALTSGFPNRDNIDFHLTSAFSPVIEQLTFNVRAGRLLNDVNIRKAIAYGTNRQELLYHAFLPNSSLGIVMHTMVPPGAMHQAARSDLTVYQYDPTTAQNLLTAAGWIDTDADGIREDGSGNELELDFKTTNALVREDSAILFTQQMQAIGIRITATHYPGSVFFSDDPAVSPLAAGDFDIAEFAWVMSEYDTLIGVYNTGDAQNFGGYTNTTLDGFHASARDAKVAGDQPTFQSNALLWQQTYADDLPSLPLFTRSGVSPVDVLPGTDVVVNGGNVSATFATVSTAGKFGMVASKYNPDDLPVGYIQGDPNVYEVGTNAGFDTANVCIHYDASNMSTANEYFLQMFHLENLTAWNNVTTPGSLDVLANEICGDFTGFSVVALMYRDEGSGSISGTVKDETSNTPITGTTVTVYAVALDGQTLEQADTDPIDGTYSISGLPLGLDFVVKVSGDDTYGGEYYDEAVLVGAATVFNLTQGTPDYFNVDFTLPAALPDPALELLTFNVRAGRVLNDPVIRRAIAYGTDRERILNKAFLGNSDIYGVALNSLILPGYWSQPSHDQVTVYPYNPATANAMLDAAGIVDTDANGIREVGGSDIVLDFKTTPTPFRAASSAIFVENMAAIGIQVVVTLVPAGEIFSSDPAVSPLIQGNFDVAEFAWVGDDLNLDDQYVWQLYQTSNFQNHGGYSNSTVDTALTAALTAADRASLLPHVLAFYAEATNDMPSLPLFTRETVTPVETANGANVLADLSSEGVTVTFQNALTEGRTAAYASDIHPDDLPLNNTRVAVFEIGSNVTMASGTGAIVCLNYDDSGLSLADENKLQLHHLTMKGARQWTNILISRDTIANQVCGFTKSFSTFAVLLPDGEPPVAFNKSSPGTGATNQPVSLGLAWGNSATATTYEYCYDTSNNNTCNGSWTSSGSNTSANISGLANNTRYYWQVRARNESGITYANSGTWWSFTTVPLKVTKTFYSTASQDGWILESSENSNLGGTRNPSATTLRLGDDAARKQYRSILSFNTSSLPNTAVITKVTLKIRKQGIVGGGNPVTMFQGFMADIKKGIFGTSALQVADWQAAANKTLGPFTPTIASGWYTFNLTSAKAYVNKLATSGGLTQIRLRFKLDDNNNAIANYLSLYSGNAGAASRPKLIIEYYVP